MDIITQSPFKASNNNRVKPQYNKSKPIKCSACPKTYSDKYSMKAHFKKVHEKQKGFLCDKCGLYLSSEKMLQRHTSVVHETLLRKSPILMSRGSSNQSNSSQDTTADTFLMSINADSNNLGFIQSATPQKQSVDNKSFEDFEDIEEQNIEDSVESFESFSFIPKISKKVKKNKINQPPKNIPYSELQNSSSKEIYPRNINLDYSQISNSSTNFQIISSNAGYINGNDKYVKYEQQPTLLYSNPDSKIAHIKEVEGSNQIVRKLQL